MPAASEDRPSGSGGPADGGATGSQRAGVAGKIAPAGSGRTGGMAALARELGYPDTVPCPFCDTSETELHSPFGSALSVATYWCRSCRTAFEWIKWG